MPIGTPYPAQVARIKELYDRLKADTKKAPLLVVNQTGVGRPVVDMLRSADLEPVAITITGGDAVSRDGHDYRVPKRDLVSVVQVLLQKVSISLKGHDSYGNDAGQWRENPHDDLVLAIALACWYGEDHKPAANDSPPSLSFSGSRFRGRWQMG